MDWVNYEGLSILATEFFRERSESKSNLLFIALQNCLIKAKNGKAKADRSSWMFYSDDVPNFLSEQIDWEIIVYDYDTTTKSPDYFEMIEDIVNAIDRDIYVILSVSDKIIPMFIQFSQIAMAPGSCLVGGKVREYSNNVLYNSESSDIMIANKGGITGIYAPHDIFPPQPTFIFPNYQALYLTVGQPNSGRREYFYNVSNIVEVEKTGNWENKIRKNLRTGYSVVLQAMNQSRADRTPAINVARGLNIPAIILWFSTRGKPFEMVTGETRPAKVYQNYIQSFQEPLKDEGFVFRLN